VYHDDLKRSLAGVTEDVLREHGAVSEQVARQLARGARAVGGADVGIGITGIAGPTGATPGKPGGLVYAAVEDDQGWEGLRLQLAGDREAVRQGAVGAVLEQVRLRLLGTERGRGRAGP
jgi:nicotinamide-nucleotide amidase